MCKRVGGVSSGIRVRVRVMWVTSRARHQSVDDQHQATSTSLFFAKGGWQKFLTRSKGQRRRALWCFHAVVHYHPHTSYSVLFLPSRFGHHIVLLHWCGSSSLHVLLPEFSALLSFDLAICSTSIGWHWFPPCDGRCCYISILHLGFAASCWWFAVCHRWNVHKQRISLKTTGTMLRMQNDIKWCYLSRQISVISCC